MHFPFSISLSYNSVSFVMIENIFLYFLAFDMGQKFLVNENLVTKSIKYYFFFFFKDFIGNQKNYISKSRTRPCIKGGKNDIRQAQDPITKATKQYKEKTTTTTTNPTTTKQTITQ